MKAVAVALALFSMSLGLVASGCDAGAAVCAETNDVTVDRYVMCNKSCLRGNADSCAREKVVATQLCHEKESLYHCNQICTRYGDKLACGKYAAAMR